MKATTSTCATFMPEKEWCFLSLTPLLSRIVNCCHHVVGQRSECLCSCPCLMKQSSVAQSSCFNLSSRWFLNAKAKVCFIVLLLSLSSSSAAVPTGQLHEQISKNTRTKDSTFCKSTSKQTLALAYKKHLEYRLKQELCAVEDCFTKEGLEHKPEKDWYFLSLTPLLRRIENCCHHVVGQ